MKAATWTDITDRFTIAKGNTSGSYVNSGVLKMNEFMAEGELVYIGLRYVNQATAIAGACPGHGMFVGFSYRQKPICLVSRL